MKINLDLGMDIEGFENEIVYEDIEKYIIDVLTKEYESDREVYVSVLLTGNEEIQRVNREFRDKDMPTDVISFAYHDNDEADNGLYDSLGDIIISLERVEEQRKDYGHSFKREFYYVLTHGLLHLMGYDHMEEEEKKNTLTKSILTDCKRLKGINYHWVEEQRKDYGHSFKREFYYVLTHGLLHLMGYDHMEEEEKKIMRAKEEEILKEYGYTRDI